MEIQHEIIGYGSGEWIGYGGADGNDLPAAKKYYYLAGLYDAVRIFQVSKLKADGSAFLLGYAGDIGEAGRTLMPVTAFRGPDEGAEKVKPWMVGMISAWVCRVD